MPKDKPDSYLADDVDTFRNLFFLGGHVDGLAIVLSRIGAVSRVFKDDKAAILNELEEAYSFRIWFAANQQPVTSSYPTIKEAREERNALLVKLEQVQS